LLRQRRRARAAPAQLPNDLRQIDMQQQLAGAQYPRAFRLAWWRLIPDLAEGLRSASGKRHCRAHHNNRSLARN
jgi:hypothetical protein